MLDLWTLPGRPPRHDNGRSVTSEGETAVAVLALPVRPPTGPGD